MDETFDLERLDRLMDTKERWEAEDARKAYVKALAAFKRNPPELVKNQQVDFSSNKGRTRYSYASLGDVAGQVAAGLAQHGLSHGWAVAQSEGMVKVTCTLTHELGHSEYVEITAPRDDSGNKNSIQQIGSAITYLQRYTLLAITGLAAHEQDDDGQASAPRPTKPPEVRTEAPAQSEQAEAPFGVAGPALPDNESRKDSDAGDLKKELDAEGDWVLKNVGELMTYANDRWGSVPSDILGALGVTKPSEIKDPNDARRQLDLLWGDKA